MAMDVEDKRDIVKTLIGDFAIDDDAIDIYLAISESRILGKMYPYADLDKTDEEGNKVYTMPEKYETLQCELASRMIFRRGFEAQLSSTENSITRQWADVDDKDIMRRIVTMVGTI